jgi:cation-transporting P-type ATPase C
MAGVDTVCFDKTGTLTQSQPVVTQITPLDTDYSEKQVLHLAARAEWHSQHSLAGAILERARREHVAPETNTDDFEIFAGRGVRSWSAEDEVLAGNERLMNEFGLSPSELAREHSTILAARAESSMFIAHRGRLVGLIAISAPVRAEAKDAVRQLHRVGIKRVVMLTGDSEPVASAVAHAVGVTEWRSRLLPEDKFNEIQALRNADHKVAMAGDGINDAPALALADVGIAMGTAGSDVAIETADIALAADDLRNVNSVVQISRQTMSVVRQNYGLALGTNSIGLYLAAVGSINPIIAAVLHNLSTILVIANSTRLIQFDPDGRAGDWRFQSGSRSTSGQPGDRECETGCCSDTGTQHARKHQLKEEAA